MTSNGNSTTSILAYGPLGRVLQSQQTPTGGMPYSFTYAYNLLDGIVSETYPSGRVVTTSYDNAGRLNGVQDATANTAYASSVGYAANNAVNSMTLGNGVVETTAFNTRFQPTQIMAGSILTLGLAYGTGTNGTTGNNGNVRTASITWPSATFNQYFVYDPMNRLLGAEETLTALATPPTPATFACPASPSTAVNWCEPEAYDAYGNRLAGTVTNVGAPVNVPTAISATTNRNSNSPWAYDLSGNITTDGLGTQYTYDAENRQITAGGSTYVYDGDGHRVLRTTGGGQTTYVYDAAGNLAAEYGTAPLAVTGTTYLTADHLGSTRLVTSAANTLVNGVSPGGAGTALECRDYLPFGEVLTVGRNNACASSDVGVTELFTSKERDAESGLDYFGARYMSSAQGRFTSPDLVNVTDERLVSPSNTLNKYIYGGNNPLKYVDPDGRDITVFYQPGFPAGHVMLAASNPQNGDFALLSVGPQIHHDPNILINPNAGVPGTSTYDLPQTADDLRQNFAALTIQTTPEVAQQAIDAIRNGAGSGNWAMNGNNCSSACAKVLHDIGLSSGSKGLLPWTPSKLWTQLLQKYAKGKNPVANAILAISPLIQRTPQMGTDYGNPRYGSNTFDFVMQQATINPPSKACVTVQGTNGPDMSWQ